LDFGLCLTFDVDDLFFFFCNSRPMMADVSQLVLYDLLYLDR